MVCHGITDLSQLAAEIEKDGKYQVSRVIMPPPQCMEIGMLPEGIALTPRGKDGSQAPEIIKVLDKNFGKLKLGNNGKYDIIGGRKNFFRFCHSHGAFDDLELDTEIINRWINHGYKDDNTLATTLRQIRIELDKKLHETVEKIEDTQKNPNLF